MIETISHQGKDYPSFQASGNAARFVIPFAQEVCKGVGVDVGCNRNEWAFPGAIPVDPVLNQWDAYNLPWTNDLMHASKNIYDQAKAFLSINGYDYIFSSHCLEHLPNWVQALDYWHSRLKSGGVVFLYLPDYSQTYWRPFFNRKHIHSFTPEIIGSYFKDQPGMWKNVFISGVDLNNSFIAMAENI